MRLEPIRNPNMARQLLPMFIALATTIVIASLLAMVAGANP
ncbi:MAG: ABC transporter permease, partial [Silicimonas sp.]|nr:ABC transporter permease [Silicimonas sp.]